MMGPVPEGGSARTVIIAGLVNLAIAAALIGILLAAAGLGLSVLTGSAVWDGAASILIGLLLVVVAASLIRSNASLLLGRSLPPRAVEQIRTELLAVPSVTAVHRLFTTVTGMGEVLVAAHVDFAHAATAAEIIAAADEAERRLATRFPAIRYVFLDPTAG